MSVTTPILYDTGTNFSYDTSQIVVQNAVAALINVPPYTILDPNIINISSLQVSSFVSFVETATYSGSDIIQYTLNISGSDYYWNGAAWVISNLTLAQSNIATVINANLGHASMTALLGTGAFVLVRAILHSATGSTTPTLSKVAVTYNFAAIRPADPSQCIVYVYLEDILDNIVGSVENAIFSCTNNDAFKYGKFVIAPFNKTVAFDSMGYAQIQVTETQTVGYNLNFNISFTQGKTTKQLNFVPCQVPDTGSVALTSITTVVTSALVSSQSMTGPFVANRALQSDSNGNAQASGVTSNELNFLSGISDPLQIAKGGTNSNTALNNNRIMKSSGGKIVEAAAITASHALVSDVNGIPVASTTTDVELGYVAGVTSAIQTQIDNIPNVVVHTIKAQGNPALVGDVVLVPGTGVTLGQAGQNITINSTGGGSGGGGVFGYYNFG